MIFTLLYLLIVGTLFIFVDVHFIPIVLSGGYLFACVVTEWLRPDLDGIPRFQKQYKKAAWGQTVLVVLVSMYSIAAFLAFDGYRNDGSFLRELASFSTEYPGREGYEDQLFRDGYARIAGLYNHLMSVSWTAGAFGFAALFLLFLPGLLCDETQSEKTVFQHVTERIGWKGFLLVLIIVSGFTLGGWAMVSGGMKIDSETPLWQARIRNIGHRSAIWWPIHYLSITVLCWSTLFLLVFIGSALKTAFKRKRKFEVVQRRTR